MKRPRASPSSPRNRNIVRNLETVEMAKSIVRHVKNFNKPLGRSSQRRNEAAPSRTFPRVPPSRRVELAAAIHAAASGLVVLDETLLKDVSRVAKVGAELSIQGR